MHTYVYVYIYICVQIDKSEYSLFQTYKNTHTHRYTNNLN